MVETRERQRDRVHTQREPLPEEGEPEDGIPEVPQEILVPAVAIEHDRDFFPRLARDQVRGDGGGVRVGFLIRGDKERKEMHDVRLYHDGMVVGAQTVGHEPGVWQLIVRLRGSADGERLHGMRGVPCHERDDRRGIDAAGEEGADGDVGDHPEPHALLERPENPLFPYFKRHALFRLIAQSPVTSLCADAAVTHIHREDGRRPELADTRETRMRRGYVHRREVVVHGFSIHLAGTLCEHAQRLQLGSEREDPPAHEVLERFLPYPVTREEQLPRPSIVNRESEHPPEPLDASLPFLAVEPEKHLGVAGRQEAVPPLHEESPDLLEIVDLPVEGEGDFAVFTHHGLRRRIRQIQDLQPPVTETDVPADTRPSPVRAAVRERIRQTIEECRLYRRAVEMDDTRDSTHGASITDEQKARYSLRVPRCGLKNVQRVTDHSQIVWRK